MCDRILRYRAAAHIRQSGRCYYCELHIWLSDGNKFAAAYGITRRQAARLKCTAEHLDPRKDGGTDRRSNIAAACLHCNWLRHKRNADLSPERFKQLVLTRLKRGRWWLSASAIQRLQSSVCLDPGVRRDDV